MNVQSSPLTQPNQSALSAQLYMIHSFVLTETQCTSKPNNGICTSSCPTPHSGCFETTDIVLSLLLLHIYGASANLAYILYDSIAHIPYSILRKKILVFCSKSKILWLPFCDFVQNQPCTFEGRTFCEEESSQIRPNHENHVLYTCKIFPL